MEENNYNVNEDIFSKVLRAGRRTYFFDVRSTKAGDYYLTISESKKFTNEDGTFYFKKHKIYLYKEDFENFSEILGEMTKYIIENFIKIFTIEAIIIPINPIIKKDPNFVKSLLVV